MAWIAVAVFALLAPCGVAGPRDGGAEQVGRLRDVLLARTRCGSQRGLSPEVCQQCLSTPRILSVVRAGGGGDVVARASVVILHFMVSFPTSCTPESIGRGDVGGCGDYDRCHSEVAARLSTLEALEGLLRQLKPLFQPDPAKPCFSAERVLSELNAKSKETVSGDLATASLLTGHLFAGECIDVGESVEDFLDDIFLHYGDGCERVMSHSGFTKLWNDLQMQRKGQHTDHGVQENACTDSRFPSNSFTESTQSPDDATKAPIDFAAEDNTAATRNGFETTSSGTDNRSDPYVENIPRNSDLYRVEGGEGHDKEEAKVELITARPPFPNRRVRHTVFPDNHEHKNLANECLPSDDLLQRFLTPGDDVITSAAFLQLCPALVQQAVSGVCDSRVKSAPRRNITTEVLLQVAPTKANPWYAVLAVTVITAASLLGLFLLPVLKKSFFAHINGFFTGLAFGTMSGDVVLHIMPQYLGLHKHDDHGHDPDTESTLNRLFPSHLQRQLVFWITMYLLFLVENLFAFFTGGGNENHQGHSHGPVDVPLTDLTIVTAPVDSDNKPKLSRCWRIADFLRPSNLLRGISSKAVVIILADTIHNFADGMAIAVGFSTSYKDGISTSVAVLFHELPHEIGDFAVLMNSGLGFWKAFVFNILSGLSAFLGLGVGVFTASVFREWLLCITAGLFFFVVMVELLPDLQLESRSQWRVFAVKTAGTLLGLGAMICIAIYEQSAA